MSDKREQRIRERAHQIWESEGRPDGQDQSHWERASREIEEEERTKTSSATERAPDALESKDLTSSRPGRQDPRNVNEDSSEGKSRA